MKSGLHATTCRSAALGHGVPHKKMWGHYTCSPPWRPPSPSQGQGPSSGEVALKLTPNSLPGAWASDVPRPPTTPTYSLDNWRMLLRRLDTSRSRKGHPKAIGEAIQWRLSAPRPAHQCRGGRWRECSRSSAPTGTGRPGHTDRRRRVGTWHRRQPYPGYAGPSAGPPP